MESVLIAVGGLLGVGSLSGLGAVIRVGSLERRVDALERGAAVARSMRVPSERIAEPVIAPPRAVDPAPDSPADSPAPPPTIASAHVPTVAATPLDRWKAIELRAGTRWTTWAGAAALVVAAALLVKLAIEEGWLGPAARLALGAACGAAFLVAGWRCQRAEMRVLAHGLFGAGLGVLYISLYVASAAHALLSAEVAFVAMVGVTIAGCTLALRQDAQALAVLAWLGGLATPILVPSVVGLRDLACAYVLLLAIAGSTIAAGRQWRALAVAAFAGTWFVLGSWLIDRHQADAWQAELAWLAVFHLALHAPLPILVWRRSIPQLWRGFAVAHAAFTIAVAGTILDGRHDVLGACALALAGCYAGLATLVRRRITCERSRFTFAALAIALLTAAIPLLARGGTLTIAWSLESLVLLVLLRDPRDARLRELALAALGIATGYALAVAVDSPAPFDRLASAIIPLCAWTFAALHHRRHAAERAVTVIAALGGAAFALLAAHAEVERHLSLATARAVTPAVWAAGSLILCAIARRTVAGQHAAAATAAIAAWWAFEAYSGDVAASHVVLNARFGAAVLVLVAFAALSFIARWAHAARLVVLVGLIAVVGAEVYSHHAGSAANTALSIAWATLAGVLLAIGFVSHRRTLRLTGLGLLGVVAAKLVLVDLAGAPPLLRVISFLVIGTVMIAASYGYHRLTSRRVVD